MENTNTRRRLAGRLMLGAAVVALPMTASISYAASEAPEVPEVSITPPEAPVAPNAPVPPLAPEVPAAPLVDEQIIVIDPDGEVEVSGADTNGDNVFVWKSEEDDGETRVIVRNNSTVRFIDRSELPGSSRMSKEALEKLIERSGKSRLVLRNRGDSIRFFDRSDLTAEGKLSDEQIEEILDDVRESLEEANEKLENLPEIIEEAQEQARAAREEAGEISRKIRVESECKGGDKEIVSEFEGDDGIKVISICRKAVMAEALSGLREARRSLKKSELRRGARSKALREIDRAIEEMEREAR